MWRVTAARSRHRLVLALVWIALVPYSVAAPDTEDKSDSIRVVVMSDLNSSYGTVGHHAYVRRAVDRIIELEPDLVIITGDMVAGQIRNLANEDLPKAMWSAFHDEVTNPIADAGIPLVVTPGNHDASALPTYSLERDQFAREWAPRMPDLQFIDYDGFPFRFAFEISDLLFIGLDVTTTGKLPDEQYDWLETLLTRNTGLHRQTIAFSHLPVWPVAAGRLHEASLDARLHALLSGSGVDVYLSGHHHAFYPGVADGVAYISQSCLGSGPRQLLGSESAREPKGFTLLEFVGDRLYVAAVTAPDFKQVLLWDTLPREISTPGKSLKRADLADVAVLPMAAESVTHKR